MLPHHPGSSYLIKQNVLLVIRPCVLNGELHIGQAWLILPDWTLDGHVQHIPHHSWRKGNKRGKIRHSAAVNAHEIQIYLNHCHLSTGTNVVFLPFDTSWMWKRLICQHRFQTRSSTSSTTKLGFPVETQKKEEGRREKKKSQYRSANIIFMLTDSCSKSRIGSGTQMYHEHTHTEVCSNPAELFYVWRQTTCFFFFFF